ncbi:SOS response-associated peptidase [Candidatus Sumerlaeota bacterium]|nr:SOS response-associated peptidase [Candidatus Sumerlaeota bacterium]
MCGRYTQTAPLTLDKLQRRFVIDWIHPDTPPGPRYNIAPTQIAPVLMQDGQRRIALPMRWGLAPSWAQDEKIGARMINARVETIAEKPSFRQAFFQRRCMALADGFYEWVQDSGGAKQPYRFVLKSREPFGFAGLWERWQPPGRTPLLTFTIITRPANQFMKPYHPRMPVILRRQDEAAWLDPELRDKDALMQLLLPRKSRMMECHPVADVVNSPHHDTPQCVEQQLELF